MLGQEPVVSGIPPSLNRSFVLPEATYLSSSPGWMEHRGIPLLKSRVTCDQTSPASGDIDIFILKETKTHHHQSALATSVLQTSAAACFSALTPRMRLVLHLFTVVNLIELTRDSHRTVMQPTCDDFIAKCSTLVYWFNRKHLAQCVNAKDFI